VFGATMALKSAICMLSETSILISDSSFMVEIKSVISRTLGAKTSKYQAKAVILYNSRFLYILFLAITFLISCSQKENVIVGSWVQPIPGQSGQVQGIRLETEGKASSINMQTLLYETWEQQGMNLILTGKSIGNRQTISFSDTLDIGILGSDILVLKRGDLELRYTRSAKDN
jgi:hypothetical protein